MKRWLRRVRGALGMGLTWGGGGAFIGFVIELVHNLWPNPLGSLVDIWPAVLAYPAFVGGLAFSVVLGIAGRRRRFDELSMPRFVAWGAVAGVLVSLVPAALATLGLVSLDVPLVRLTVGLVGPLTLACAAAAAGSLALARAAEDRELLDASHDGADVGLTEQEMRELQGGDRER